MKDLASIAKAVLDEKSDHKTLHESILAMHDMYASFTGIKAHDVTDKNISLPSGEAISPIEAAHCLLQIRRTTVFLRGIYKAILQLKSDFPGEKINILYAGCGPYATLLTPFTSLFSPAELAFHMLDISQVSLDSVKKLYTSLGAEEYIKDFICTDAATYQLPPGRTMHLVISETMQRALAKEPQVAIMLNLIPQMADKAIFIPEEINISLKLLSWEEEQNALFIHGHKPERIHVGQVYAIGRQQCEAHTRVAIPIPNDTGKFKHLNLFTDITVFRDERLHTNNTSITLPQNIGDITGMNGKKIALLYEISNSPRFHHEWVD